MSKLYSVLIKDAPMQSIDEVFQFLVDGHLAVPGVKWRKELEVDDDAPEQIDFRSGDRLGYLLDERETSDKSISPDTLDFEADFVVNFQDTGKEATDLDHLLFAARPFARVAHVVVSDDDGNLYAHNEVPGGRLILDELARNISQPERVSAESDIRLG